MRIAVRVIELAGKLEIPTDLNEYDGVKLYLAIRGEVKGQTIIWNAHTSLLQKKFRYPADFGSWLMLSNTFFSPLGAPPIDQNVIKGLLCAKAGISSEGTEGDYCPAPPPLPPAPSLIKPLDICFVSTQYPPETNYGGIATYTHTAARALVRRGHRVTVISVAHDGNKDSQKIVEGVNVVRISEPASHTTVAEDWRRNQQTWQAVKEFKPQIVQLVDYLAEGFLLSLMNRHNYGIITRLADYSTLTKLRYQMPRTFRREALHFMARQQVLRSNALFAPSRFFAQMIERDEHLRKGSIRHIANSVNLAELNRYSKSEPVLKIDEPYLIYFGRFEEIKGITFLARALPLVWAKFPDLKFVFAGLHSIYELEGLPAKDFVEKQAGKYAHNLYFTNYLTREQVLALVARAKLAVLPSIWETFSFTCLEAIALGVPVITTRESGGPAEIIAGSDESGSAENTAAGWLVPRRNPAALAEAIIHALSNEKEFEQIKQNTWWRAKQFDDSAMCDKLELLYQEVYQKL